MKLNDGFDPWDDTTPLVDLGRDDPFGDWPTDTTIGEVTGPHSYQGLVVRAAAGGARGRRRRLAWWFALSWVALSVGLIAVQLAVQG